MNNQREVQVCFTPYLYPLFEKVEQVVVVVDILRATSAICTAIAHKIDAIIPVETIEEAKSYYQKNFIVAGERNGEKLDGFELGNSPFSYMDEKLKGKKIALTTTNGTQAIKKAYRAELVIIGSFLNLDALAKFLNNQNHDVLILCAGWKNKFNLEDTLFAGALADKLISDFNFFTTCDSTRCSRILYEKARENMYTFLEDSSHRERLGKLHLEKDIEFCLQTNIYNAVPVLDKNGFIIDSEKLFESAAL